MIHFLVAFQLESDQVTDFFFSSLPLRMRSTAATAVTVPDLRLVRSSGVCVVTQNGTRFRSVNGTAHVELAPPSSYFCVPHN